jgi:hypothetical protein
MSEKHFRVDKEAKKETSRSRQQAQVIWRQAFLQTISELLPDYTVLHSCLLLVPLLGLHLNPEDEDEGGIFLLNMKLSLNCVALQPRRP